MKHTYKAFAKINLLLDVTGRLSNGYHTVQMIMQSISLHDTVTVEQTDEPGIAITCDVPSIPTDERNIVHKACKAFGLDSGLHIHIEKKIPSQAGLAGGSADAAAVLTALRDMFKPGMPMEKLCEIGMQVGADVPFCLIGGCCYAEGLGEQLSPLPCLPRDYRIALVKPDFGVSTAQAYAALDSIDIAHPDTQQALAHARSGEWEAMFPLCANVFEQVLDLPGLAQAKEKTITSVKLAITKQNPAKLVQLTGSGSVVFAIDGAGALAGLGEYLGEFAPVDCGVARKVTTF
ncbi:MAG: 4-(cytidine 5'-diphospho)-2-C-methyl-D-erythritol kinase [Oscillospiraceae bacterium]|nr:4-(cytidine 5'-diphospho)-2-C-methyl-D-erythritol kinase [Oscillospiraceae bacterium]